MHPLIDADILLHEIGWSGEWTDKETGEEILLPFSSVQDILDGRVKDICEAVNATVPPTLFISSSEEAVALHNAWHGDYKLHEPNLRYDIAKTKPYKGTRKDSKPFHFYNILAYMFAEYDVVVSSKGREADDEMGIWQTSTTNQTETIICSRDKDLRMVPGWHYSWEVGRQREVAPTYTDVIGWLSKDMGKVTGYGHKFFWYQMLIGDSVDNIPGIKGYGPVKAYRLLHDIDDERQLYNVVQHEYKKNNLSLSFFEEQWKLLFIEHTPRPLFPEVLHLVQ